MARRLRPRRPRTLPALRHARQAPVFARRRRLARLDGAASHAELRGPRHHRPQPPRDRLRLPRDQPRQTPPRALPPRGPRRDLPKTRHDSHAHGRRARHRRGLHGARSRLRGGAQRRRGLKSACDARVPARPLGLAHPRAPHENLAPLSRLAVHRRAPLGDAGDHQQVRRRRLRRRRGVLHRRRHVGIHDSPQLVCAPRGIIPLDSSSKPRHPCLRSWHRRLS
mmetsp:Transcript_12226/g.49246  ORF Transcript_12226/g.49246 Transcript_12226/m.49246 type:complete len:223 (+) Transcript_12226:1779-2447(+)